MNLWDAAQWILGGGCGPLVYWLMENVYGLSMLEPKAKRFVSLGLACVVSWGAFFLTLWMGAEVPTTPQEWVNKLFAVAFAAIVASQGIHGVQKLGPAV
jgi:uncharacterized membrane protein